MAVLQSTYTSRHLPLALGQFRNTELKNTVTRQNDDADGTVGFGRAMFRGAGIDGVTATPSAFFDGVTVRTESVEGANDTFKQRESLSLLDHGVIGVAAAVAVVRGEAAYVTPAGAWTNVSAGNTAIVGAKFDETIIAAGLVALRVK